MRRLFPLLILLAGCHSVTIRVVRGSSGAVERDDVFVPRPDRHGHYISTPPMGLVDCPDLLLEDVGAKPCTEYQRGRRLFRFANAIAPTAEAVDLAPRTTTLMRTGDVPTVTPGVPDGAYFLSAPRDASVEASFVHVADNTVVGGKAALPWLGDDEKVVELRRVTRPEAVAAFIHVSDVQIREPGAKLGGEEVSHRLDPLVQSFEHDYEQELFSSFVFRAIVDTINADAQRLGALRRARWRRHGSALGFIWRRWDRARAAVSDPRREAMPSAVIHTGDAVDAGLQSEFDDFLALSDHLTIPWYQSVGNHDLLAFGNMQLLAEEDRHDDRTCDGAAWDGVACTCTPVSVLVREYNLRHPDNRGCEPEHLPNQAFTLIPLALQRVCVVHHVVADRFVMDPYRQYDASGHVRRENKKRTSLGAFIAAHCRSETCDDARQAHLPDDPAHPWWPRYAARAPQVTLDTSRIAAAADGPPRELGPVDAPCGTRAGDADARSQLNGFDLLWLESGVRRAPTTTATGLGRAGRLGAREGELGYYCFELEQEPGSSFARAGKKIWIFVLNTSTNGGAYGELSASQLRWLDQRLDRTGASDLVLLFAHHPIWGIYDAGQRRALLTILGEHPNVVAYFAGHTHESLLRVVHAPGRHRFWEVVAPSTLVYPQQARRVTVHVAGSVGWLDVVSFSPVGSGQNAEYLERALAGAQRDKCHQSPDSCDEGRPRPPAREVTFPRLYFRVPGGVRSNWPAAGGPAVDLAGEGRCPVGWEPPTWLGEGAGR